MMPCFLSSKSKVRVGESARTPMLLRDDFSRLRFELAADLATPGAIFKGLRTQGCLLDWRNVFPGLVVARLVTMMHCVENSKTSFARSIEDFQHMRNTIICFGNILYPAPDLTSLGNEIVVRVDDEKRGDRFFQIQLCHVLPLV